ACLPVPAHGLRRDDRRRAGAADLRRHADPAPLPGARGGLLMTGIVGRRAEGLSGLARRALFYLLLTLGALAFLLPFLYMVSTAFKVPRELYDLHLVPREPPFDHFAAVFTQIPIGPAIFTSAFVYLLQTASVLVFSSIVGYALSRLRFFGREFVFNVTLL